MIPMIHYTDSSSSSEMIMMVKINLGLDIQSNFLKWRGDGAYVKFFCRAQVDSILYSRQ